MSNLPDRLGHSNAPEIIRASRAGVIVATTTALAWGALSFYAGVGLGIGGGSVRTAGTQTGAFQYGKPNAPSCDVVVFAPTSDSLRIQCSAFVGSGDDTHAATAILVDTAGGGWNPPAYFADTLGAVLTDTIPALDSASFVDILVAYEGDNGRWSDYDTIAGVEMVYAAIDLYSDWDNGDLDDGGFWDSQTPSMGTSGDVVAGSTLNWTLTDSVLRVNGNAGDPLVCKVFTAFENQEDFRFKYHYYQSTTATGSMSHSPSIPQTDASGWGWAGRMRQSGNNYNLGLIEPSHEGNNEWAATSGGSFTNPLAEGSWYRVEYFIDFVTLGNPASYAIYMEVYNDAGTLLYDTDDLGNEDDANYKLTDAYDDLNFNDRTQTQLNAYDDLCIGNGEEVFGDGFQAFAAFALTTTNPENPIGSYVE